MYTLHLFHVFHVTLYLCLTYTVSDVGTRLTGKINSSKFVLHVTNTNI